MPLKIFAKQKNNLYQIQKGIKNNQCKSFRHFIGTRAFKSIQSVFELPLKIMKRNYTETIVSLIVPITNTDCICPTLSA
jgi:hypothetical protein